jgi:FkbM family methyltransferase
MDVVAAMPKALRRWIAMRLKARGLVPAFKRELVDTIWIDVGAHLGEFTLDAAINNPRLLVFAFEPNWELSRQIMGRAANFVVLPMAVSETDGIAKFFINSNDGSSSLLPIDGSSAAQWGESVNFSVIGEVSIPTIRLDTFMHLAKIERVDYLKVDAEGADLLVIKSAADRIRDIRTIKAEVEVCDFRSFVGAPSKVEMISFMKEKGFSLTAVESQNEDRQENLTFTQTNIL